MKLAMHLPGKNAAAADRDPREDATTEVIDLASRTSYPAVANRKGRSDALGLAAGVGFVALLGIATLYGLNAARTGEEPAPAPASPTDIRSTGNTSDGKITKLEFPRLKTVQKSGSNEKGDGEVKE